MPDLHPTRRAALLAGLAVGVGAGVAACSRSAPVAQPAPAPSPTPTPSPTTTTSPRPTATPTASVDTRPRWPLTGALLQDAADARHAAVAVKVPDNKFEHPQRGLDKADIVFVELEGYRDAAGYSQTRLMPVFHSRMPDSVAPVRSIRPVDVPLLSPMDAIIGNTGAAPWVLNYVKANDAHLEGMLSYMNTKGSGSYGIDGSRVYHIGGKAYYDRATLCHPTTLARQTTRFRAGPTQAYFPFAASAEEASTAKGKAARTVRVPYKGTSYAMSYTYDARTKRYLRSMPWGPHTLVGGTRVAPDNVLVVKARQHYGKIYKGRGGNEPLHDIVDTSGRFYYANRGRYVMGTWKKGGVAEPFRFTLADGSPLRMAPGQTYVELPDDGATIGIGS